MLIRHTLLYLPAQFIGPAIQFASILIWAHLLTPDDIGVVTLTIAIQEMSFALFFMWWSHYALRYISSFQGQESRRRFLASEATAMGLCCLVQSAIVIPVLLLYFKRDVSTLALLSIIAFMLTRSVSNYMSERARSETHIGLYTFIQTAGPLFGLLFGLVLIFTVSRSPASVFAGFSLMQGATLAIAILLSDFGRARPRLDPEVLWRAASFGIPVMMAQMLALVAVNAPRFVVEHTMGLSAVGIFSVGYGLGLRASSVAILLVTAGAYPLVVRKMELEGLAAAYDQLAKNITMVALVAAPVAFGLLAVNASVVDLLVPEAFREATYLVLPISTIGGMMIYLRAHTTDQVFLVRSRPGFITMISIVDLVCGVLSAYAGIRLYGVAGAAAGPMVSGAVTLTVSFYLSRRLLGFQLPAAPLMGIFASAVLMLVLVRSMPAGPGFIGLGARIVGGGLIYGAGILAFLPVVRIPAFHMAQRLLTRFG